jgi:hypothetical protein
MSKEGQMKQPNADGKIGSGNELPGALADEVPARRK